VPGTRGERIIFAICTLAIAVLLAVIALEVTTDRFEAHRTPAFAASETTGGAITGPAASAPPLATEPTTRETGAVPEPTTGDTTRGREPATGETTTSPEPVGASTGVRLTLAARADSWVEVRSASANGNVLYSGILPQGSVKHFSSTRVWVRFGAAANLTARLNGRRLLLPTGTYDALIGARGLQLLSG
jgi:hypothetical protein